MALRLKTTCAPNPRIDPLVEGLVSVPNVEFDWDLKPVPMLFLNNIKLDRIETYYFQISSTLFTRDNFALVGIHINMDIGIAFGASSGRHF